jgi:Skp family chaperone for outer membrane proteins
MQKVNEAMVQVVSDIVKERQYQIVLTKTQIVIVQTALDITPEVLRRLNRKLPTVAVSIPQK